MVAAENAAGEAGARAATAEAALAAYQRDNPGGDGDELARLQGELAAARAAEESARAAAAEAIADLRRVEAERDAAKAATAEANRRANTATEKIAALEAEIAGLRQARADDNAKLAAASDDVKRLKATIAEITGRDGADIGKLTEENRGLKGEIAELRGQVGPYQTQIEDLRAQLRAKTAELEDLRRSCGEKDFRISQLEVENRRIREELEAERARSTRLLAYLTELSTAITRGGPIPALPADVPDIGDLIIKIGELRTNADPSKYLCLLSYYVKFFMTLLFNQPGGKAAYNALKDYIGPSISSGLGIIDEAKCYTFLESLKRTFDGAQGGIDLINSGLDIILQKVFGEANDLYRSVAAFVVASQLYLSRLYGLKRLPGCRVAPIILDPIGNLPRGEGVPTTAPVAAPAPAPAPARAPTTTYEYDYLKNPTKPYTEVSRAAQEAFNVEPVDQPVLTTVAKAKEYLADVKNAIRASGGVRFPTMGGNIDDYIRGKWSSKSKLDTVCTHKPAITGTGEICGEFNGLMNKNFSSLRSDAFKEQAAKDKLKALNLLR
jgi:predicted  nucleic acid-binding Zn-ribbon protein